jgi:DNA-binding transcriptional MerR regulator
MMRAALRSCVTLLLAALAGCSLISLKSPERPLSPRDMNARILTRELTTEFIETNARSTDSILRSETDAAVLNNVLRWELGVIVTSRNAETQLAPMMTLLDTWALALQLQAFAGEGGRGAALFGTHQSALREVTDNYADGAQRLAHSLLTAREFTEYQSFVSDYVRAHPLQDLRFARISVTREWSRVKGADSSVLDEVGTIPQALADTTQRLQIYGDTVPLQSMRRTQLALREAGYTPDEIRAALARLDARLERLTTVAESAPELVRGAEAELRESLRELFNRLDASARGTAAAFHSEREALFADLETQRAALTATVDAQRQALTADARRLADQLVRTSGEEVRHLTREALLLLIVLALVVLGLPFAAGYLTGRARSALSARAT